MSRKLRHRSHHGNHEHNGAEHVGEHEHDAELEALAYEYWQKRGSPIGSPDEDWFRAEEELNRRDEAASRL